MIHPLRKAHLGIWLVVPLLLGMLFWLGLSRRQETLPRNSGLDWEHLR